MVLRFLPRKPDRPPQTDTLQFQNEEVPGFERFLRDKFAGFQQEQEPDITPEERDLLLGARVKQPEVPVVSDVVTPQFPVRTPEESTRNRRYNLLHGQGLAVEEFEGLTPDEKRAISESNEIVNRVQSPEGESRYQVTGTRTPSPLPTPLWYQTVEKAAVGVAQTPITVGPVTLEAGAWAGLLGITIATGGAIIAGLPVAYNLLINASVQRNINKWSIATNQPISPALRKSVADWLASTARPSWANTGKAIKELFKPSATGRFVPTPQATAKAETYTNAIVKKFMPEFTKTSVDRVVRDINAGVYNPDFVPPSVQAVRGVVGQLAPEKAIISSMNKGAFLQLGGKDSPMHSIVEVGKTRTMIVDGEGNKQSIPNNTTVTPLEVPPTTPAQVTPTPPTEAPAGAVKIFDDHAIRMSAPVEREAGEFGSKIEQEMLDKLAGGNYTKLPDEELLALMPEPDSSIQVAIDFTKAIPANQRPVLEKAARLALTRLKEQGRELPNLKTVHFKTERIKGEFAGGRSVTNVSAGETWVHLESHAKGVSQIPVSTADRMETTFHEMLHTAQEFEGRFLQPTPATLEPAVTPPEAVSEGIPPQVATQAVNEIQQQGTIAPKTVPPEEAKYSHIEKSNPAGPQPPSPPRPPAEEISPESSPRDIFKNILDKQLEGESLSEATVRLYGGAVRQSIKDASNRVQRINDQLKALDIGQVKRGQLVPTSKDIPVLRELYIALHNPSGVAAGEVTIPAGFEAVYEDLRALADWDTASRLDFDPNAATLTDWFFRGWKPPEGKFTGAPGRGGLVTEPKALRTPRVDSTFEEMLELGFEPLFWNPAHQWQYRHNLGETYREQMELVDFLKKQGVEFIMPDSGGPMREGWSIPRIGPAFEGKPYATQDADGLPTVMFTQRWAVPNKTASLLESMFGRRPDLTVGIGQKEINLNAVLDAVSFTPKRAKLFLSFFQQIDFLNRAGSSSFAKALDDIFAGKPIDAAISILKYPKTVVDIVHANFSPSTRLSLSEQMSDTTPLVKGHLGVHLKGIGDAGINFVDVTLLSEDIDKLVRLVAKESGVWSKFKGIGDALVEAESAMRRGLFQGTYPAAMITDIQNNTAVMMARQHPRATDEQLNGYIAQEINMKYSLLPAEQSVVHKTWLREFLRRVAFSFNESEALIRQTTRMFHGPNKKFWVKQNIGVILFLGLMASIIHYASTGEPLPKERWIPIAEDNWGPLPYGYNTKFLAPTLPIRGRGDVEITADLMGQMDTFLRLLNPEAFLTSRLQVFVRTIMNQVNGTDFYGASMEGPAQRAAYAAYDLFAPIGVGGIGTEALRQNIPGAEDVLPEGESRLGLTGLALQATGLNVRAEGTREVLDRKAREAGFFKDDGTPVMNWDELEPHQRKELNQDRALIAELALRRETALRRDTPGAAGSVKMEELDQARITRGESLVDEFEQGRYPGTSEFTREVTKLKAEIANRRSQVDDDFQLFKDTDELPQDPNKRALVEYYNIFDMATRESGTVDWLRVEQIEDAYRTQVWNDAQEAFVDRNVGITEWGPKMQEYIDARKTLSDSGYWDLRDPNVFEKRQALRLAKPEIDRILQEWHLYKPVKPPSAFFPQRSRADPFGREKTNPFGQQRKTPVFK